MLEFCEFKLISAARKKKDSKRSPFFKAEKASLTGTDRAFRVLEVEPAVDRRAARRAEITDEHEILQIIGGAVQAVSIVALTEVDLHRVAVLQAAVIASLHRIV